MQSLLMLSWMVCAAAVPTAEAVNQSAAALLPGIRVHDSAVLGADVDGDGKQDVVALVELETSTENIQKSAARALDVDPASSANGKALGRALNPTCLGVWVQPGAEGTKPFLLIPECSSSLKIMNRRDHRLANRMKGKKGKGAVLVLETEAGGSDVLYWDGATFRGLSLRAGD